MFKYLKRDAEITHEILLHTMPFGSGWLSDTEDDASVDPASVMIGTALFMIRRHAFTGKNPDEPEIN